MQQENHFQHHFFPAAAPLGPRGRGPSLHAFLLLAALQAVDSLCFANDVLHCLQPQCCQQRLQYDKMFAAVLCLAQVFFMCSSGGVSAVNVLHPAALPMLIDAGGECFAPHLTFRFWKGECHKFQMAS